MRLLSLTVLLFASLTPLSAQAGEINVCDSLVECMDILERHPPNAFDYTVLASEFTRFGPQGQAMLVARARDPKLAPRIFALARQPSASGSLRQALLGNWPVPAPALHLTLAPTVQSPVLRRRAIATLNAPSPVLREASIKALATQSSDIAPEDAQAAFASLARSAANDPHAPVLKLLARVPGERGAPLIVRALSSNNAEAITTAYLALEALNPERAHTDLKAAFLASPVTNAPAWTTALEQIGMRSQTFDTIGYGYEVLANNTLSATHRAVGLHSALLYPAGEKGKVAKSAASLLPELLTLPVSSRLATTAPSHPLFADPQTAEQLASVWASDTLTLASYISNLGKAGTSNHPALLLPLFDQTSDYRVQLSVLAALRKADASQFKTRIASHPITAVRRAGAKHIGSATTLSRTCFARGKPFAREPQRLPYFQSGRLKDRPAGRWELVDAEPLQGGWLAAYRDGVIRYSSEDSSTLVKDVPGRPLAVLPDVPRKVGERGTIFWLLSTDDQITTLTRYADGQPLGRSTTLPPGARVIENRLGPSETHRAWALAFPAKSDQPTLHLTRAGRLQALCDPPKTN